MKTSILFLALAIGLSSCKKEDPQPEGYFPKPGDTYETLVANWGKPLNVKYISPAFNSDADFYYVEHKTTIRFIPPYITKVIRDK